MTRTSRRYLIQRYNVSCLLVGLVLAFAVSSASAVPIPLIDIAPAGFVGQTEQGPLDTPVHLSSYAEFTTVFGASTAGLANPYLAPSVAAFFANGGQDLWVVRTAGADDASLIGVDGGFGLRTGLQALIEVDEVGAVAIPGALSPPVQLALIAHCEAMGDRMAILDPVSMTDPNAVIAQRGGLTSADGYASLYFPWIVGTPTGVSLTLPPSGFVAGVYARNSPEDSPAGPTNGLVMAATDASYAVSTTLQNTLNPLGIDAIRYFSGQGVLLFGARTLASNVEWQYVAVRRMGLAIEESITEGTAWAVTEPNDLTLWNQLESDVEDFLHSLYLAGWFQGASAAEAYFAQCGFTTMTLQDIEEGRTIIEIGYAPLTPSEFIVHEFVIDRSTLSVPAHRPRLQLHPPRPNPTRLETTLAFELAGSGAVTLRVHDAAGRIVRTLAAGESFPAGRHQRSWDGRDERGRVVRAGVYVVSLEAPGGRFTRRIAVLR